jgi:hypothetical protein
VAGNRFRTDSDGFGLRVAQKLLRRFRPPFPHLGLQATLQRGFTIARDEEDKELTGREAAMQVASFRDGVAAVDNREYVREESFPDSFAISSPVEIRPVPFIRTKFFH